MPGSIRRIAVINDLTGFGRCSLTVQLPVLSSMGLQVCPVPTAVLSNHCGFDHFFFDDYTDRLPAYLSEWRRLGLTFDAVYTGFLGSQAQIDIVADFIREFTVPGAVIMVDPVMGDEGVIPPPYDDALCCRMRQLIRHADIITPNLTEAAKLCDRPYQPDPDDALLAQMGRQLLDFGCKTVVITGVQRGQQVGNYVCRRGAPSIWIWNPLCGQRRVGTGDLFSSVLLGSLLRQHPLEAAVQQAAEFTRRALQYSRDLQIPIDDGICFEPLLHQLTIKEV